MVRDTGSEGHGWRGIRAARDTGGEEHGRWRDPGGERHVWRGTRAARDTGSEGHGQRGTRAVRDTGGEGHGRRGTRAQYSRVSSVAHDSPSVFSKMSQEMDGWSFTKDNETQAERKLMVILN